MHGVNYEPSEKTKSDLYRDLLPLINSGAVDLLEHDRLLTQLTSLERRTARGGRDSIDHAPGAHDEIGRPPKRAETNKPPPEGDGSQFTKVCCP